ncbi:MAG TPA: hypothetical protein VGZ02_16365 [Candidatus Baltobacteraceae bacterium]|jgi:plastocyanin|nr:hypothetical protein [Candidatus Baltobacteraceae bacterium]
MKVRAALVFPVLALLGACTPGGSAPPPGGGTATQTIDVNLTLHAPVQTQAGESGGFSPPVTTVTVGSTVRFFNSDGTGVNHTATLLAGSPVTFPSSDGFSASALQQSGATISSSWTSGAMVSGTGSQVILVDKAGTYLYGCFFHYASPMRGVIVAQ